jgi:hypothetical protein
MFKFIKDLFRPKKSIEKTIKVEADAKLITTELVLASFIAILKTLWEQGSFNKKYQCINNFMSIEVPEVAELLNFNELMQVDVKYLYESKILVLAKRYSVLHCKSRNEKFDNWMHKLAAEIYKP